jgi:hypothetical protein
MKYLTESVNALRVYVTPKEIVRIVQKECTKKKY